MSESYLPSVTGVAVMGESVLRLLFSDGTSVTSISQLSSGQASWNR